MATKYDNSSINQLLGASRIRTRPASMLGSSGLAGARHGFTEIYGNALDERSAGFGNRLDVCWYADGSVSVRDYGRGVPIGWNDNPSVQNWNWHTIYNELYAGGKYDNGQWYLSAVDKDYVLPERSDKFLKAKNAILKEFSFDITTLKPDNSWHKVKDMNIAHTDNNTYLLRVNNESWATLTWEKLNERLNYLASVGLNGLGAASTQYTSEFFIVKSYRDGKVMSRSFSRGIPLVDGKPFDMFSASKEEIKKIPEEIEDTTEPNGTFIHWKPDDTVFDDVNIGGDWLYDTCRDIADVANIELHFKDEQKGFEEVIEAGNLSKLALKHCGESNLQTDENGEPIIIETNKFTHGNIKIEGSDFVYVCKCDISFGVVTRRVQNACFHNSVKMLSGVQYEAVQEAIGNFMTEKAKASGLKLERTDYENIFGVFVSSYSNYASFRNQTKDAVDDLFIYTLIRDTLYEKLQTEYGKGNRLILDAIDTVLKEAEIRIATREFQKLKRETEKIKREKEPEKFVSCTAYENKNYKQAELWITEGDSAKGAVKNARNKDFQAIYPIRGKSLNVLKANIKRILQNKEIRELFSLLGTGFDMNLKDEKTFNINDLKFDKIIFATDADEDGYQIRVLLYLIFYKLAPELIKQGHVYIAETPRFEISLANGTIVYALNDAERDKILKENVGAVVNGRFKGLGEVDEDVLRNTTVHPDTRHLIRLTLSFDNEFEREMIDALFGLDKYHQRKELITTVLGFDMSDIFDDKSLGLDEVEVSDNDK